MKTPILNGLRELLIEMGANPEMTDLEVQAKISALVAGDAPALTFQLSKTRDVFVQDRMMMARAELLLMSRKRAEMTQTNEFVDEIVLPYVEGLLKEIWGIKYGAES